jgi:hypothetical protein
MNAQLWAVTSYVNPTRSPCGRANDRAFCTAIAAPLLTVEWSPAYANGALASDFAGCVGFVSGTIRHPRRTSGNAADPSTP